MLKRRVDYKKLGGKIATREWTPLLDITSNDRYVTVF